MSSIKVSAPGSVMLLGEHAVLHHLPAVIAAINRRLHITLTPRTDNKIKIHSDLFGTHEIVLEKIAIKKPFQFVLAAIQYFQASLTHGFNLDIQSQFSDQIGLGSSAAVTVATISAIQQLLTDTLDLKFICQVGTKIIREIQGAGSGADIAASVYGGMLAYQTNPFIAEKLISDQHFPDIQLIYTGYKTPTIDVIKHVGEHYQSNTSIFDQIFEAIGECTRQGILAITKKDWKSLGEFFNIHQGLQDALQVNDRTLSEIIYTCREQPEVLGAKISGSGLGDCVVLLGQLPKNFSFQSSTLKNAIPIDAAIDARGLTNET